MVRLNSYSERIAQNEQRIAELKGKLYTIKLSIKSLEKENERCFEAMNNLTAPIEIDEPSEKNEKVELQLEINSLKKERTQLKHDLKQSKVENKYLQTKCNDLKNELLCLKQTRNNDELNIESNIFYQIKEES